MNSIKESIKNVLKEELGMASQEVVSNSTNIPIQDMYLIRAQILYSSDKYMSDLQLDIRVLEGVSTLVKLSTFDSKVPNKSFVEFDIKYKVLNKELIGNLEEIEKSFKDALRSIPYISYIKITEVSPISRPTSY